MQKRVEVRIRTTDDLEIATIQGELLLPGLALHKGINMVTRTPAKAWQVTHLPSGLRVLMATKRQTLRDAVEDQDFRAIDWTLPTAAALTEAFPEAPKLAKRVQATLDTRGL